jgi:hypothetical protein
MGPMKNRFFPNFNLDSCDIQIFYYMELLKNKSHITMQY